MGRLFWKFFFFILLAQLLAAVSIGSTFWLKERNQDQTGTVIDRAPPAIFMVSAAASTLKYGGIAALQNLIRSEKGLHQIYAVDEQGRELLGREVNVKMIGELNGILGQNSTEHAARELKIVGGHSYILFVASKKLAHDKTSMHSLDKGPLFRADGPPSLQDYPLMLVLPQLAAVIASLIFAALLAWYFSKPIRNLRAAFGAIAKGDFDTKVAPRMGTRRDELANLGRDFDNMAAQLRALMEGQRRLLHDVSHELRSPLARMQVAIGLAHQQPDKLESSMERIERESVRMDKLVGELLTLSRLEAGVKTSMNVDIDIDEMLMEIIENAQFEAETKNCKVEIVGNCKVLLNGQPELIYSAIENVLRNAVRFTAVNTNVLLESRVDEIQQQWFFSVLDDGPGVSEQDLQAIFEPFFRCDDSMINADGHGLGLAIARRVVTMCGGSISATNRSEGGLRINISLPIKLLKH